MYACSIVSSSGQCEEWINVIVGLPPLTQSQVYELGGAFLLLYTTAFCLGLLARMLLRSGANRFD
jgi:hypothetical protein